MYCKSCGQKLDDNSRFCTRCGSPVDGAASQPNVKPQSQPVSAPAASAAPAAPAQKPAKKGSGILPALIICIAVFVIYMVISESRSKPTEFEVVTRPTISLGSPEIIAPESSVNPEYDLIFSGMGIVDSDRFPNDSYSYVVRTTNGSVQKYELYAPMDDNLAQFEITFYAPTSMFSSLEEVEQAMKDLYPACVKAGCAVVFPSFATKDYYSVPMLFSSLTDPKNMKALYEDGMISDPYASSISFASFDSTLLRAGYIKK